MPAAARAFRNSSRKVNSSSSRSYSAFTSARSRARDLSSLCVSIFDLLHSPSGYGKFPAWGLVGFLDELMQDHDLSPSHHAKEYAGDPLCHLQSHLKQSFTHCAGVRHTQVWPVYLHSARIAKITSKQTGR